MPVQVGDGTSIPARRALHRDMVCQPNWLVSPVSPTRYRQPPVAGCWARRLKAIARRTAGSSRRSPVIANASASANVAIEWQYICAYRSAWPNRLPSAAWLRTR